MLIWLRQLMLNLSLFLEYWLVMVYLSLFFFPLSQQNIPCYFEQNLLTSVMEGIKANGISFLPSGGLKSQSRYDSMDGSQLSLQLLKHVGIFPLPLLMVRPWANHFHKHQALHLWHGSKNSNLDKIVRTTVVYLTSYLPPPGRRYCNSSHLRACGDHTHPVRFKYLESPHLQVRKTQQPWQCLLETGFCLKGELTPSFFCFMYCPSYVSPGAFPSSQSTLTWW